MVPGGSGERLLLLHSNVSQVREALLHVSLRDGAGVLHGGARIYFYEPDVVARIHHKIVPKYLMGQMRLILHNGVSRGEDTGNDALFEKWEHSVLIDAVGVQIWAILRRLTLLQFVQKQLELLISPHISMDAKLLDLVRIRDIQLGQEVAVVGSTLNLDIFFIYGGVCQVGELVVELIGIVVVARKPQVVFRVEPYFKLGLPARDAHPLPDVKLLLLDDQGRLNVLLGHPNLVHARSNVIVQVVLGGVNLYAPTPRLAAGLHNPRILCAIQCILVRAHSLLQLCQQRPNMFLGVLGRDIHKHLVLLVEFDEPGHFLEVLLASGLALDKVIDIITNEVQLIVLTGHHYCLVRAQEVLAHELDAAVHIPYRNDYPIHILLQVGLRHIHCRLQARHQLPKLHLRHEILEFLAIRIRQIVALREHLVDVGVVLPNEVFHIMRQSHLGSQCFRALKMINLLERGRLVLEGISALGGVAEVESVHSIVICVIKRINRILNPPMPPHRIPHILILSQHNKYFLGGINVIFFPKLLNCISSPLIHLLLRQIFTSALLLVGQLEYLLLLNRRRLHSAAPVVAAQVLLLAGRVL